MQAYICECTTGQDFTMHMHVIDIFPSKTVVHIKLFERLENEDLPAFMSI
jgi:hypothetical protein